MRIIKLTCTKESLPAACPQERDGSDRFARCHKVPKPSTTPHSVVPCVAELDQPEC